jgi:Domain of unknown function (DUF4190)
MIVGLRMACRPTRAFKLSSTFILSDSGRLGRGASVATDQTTIAVDTENQPAGSPIENELPSYRAISARSVLSLVCGLLAVCSFAHSFFYVFTFLAIGLGIWAHYGIKRFPDMLTGHGLANAGIALGLTFGLISGTVSMVEYLVRTSQAQKFGKDYQAILQAHSLGEILWYNTHPDSRKDQSPAQVLEDFEKIQAKQKPMMESKMGEMLGLQRRLASSNDQKVHFVSIEAVGEDANHGELQVFALALYEVDGPPTKQFPQEHQYALAILKARPKGRRYDWWVEDIKFPYKPKSYQAAQQPVDDGHGHGQ